MLINVAEFELISIFLGDARETAPGMSSMEVIQSRKSRDLSTQNSQGFEEENQDTSISFEKDGVHSVNGSSRHGLTEKRSPANRINLKVKQADTKTDLWWLNLNYVFVSSRKFLSVFLFFSCIICLPNIRKYFYICNVKFKIKI